MAFIEPCFGIGHSLSLICQMTSEDIKHQLIIIIFRGRCSLDLLSRYQLPSGSHVANDLLGLTLPTTFWVSRRQRPSGSHDAKYLLRLTPLTTFWVLRCQLPPGSHAANDLLGLTLPTTFWVSRCQETPTVCQCSSRHWHVPEFHQICRVVGYYVGL